MFTDKRFNGRKNDLGCAEIDSLTDDLQVIEEFLKHHYQEISKDKLELIYDKLE